MSGEQGWRTWRVAMADALYGPGGFYRRSGAPRRNFRTAAHVSPAWAQCWLTAARAVHDSLPASARADFSVVEMAAGGGELLAALAGSAPDSWRLIGVEVAARPTGLPDRVEWQGEPPASVTGLCLAVEWLDVVPVDVVELTASGPRLVEVDDAGNERLGQPAGRAETEWLDRWWPLVEPGNRAEPGHPRAAAWRGLADRVEAGVAVAVDYAVDPRRDLAGTLTGYRDGRQTRPVPDGGSDITAHVHLAACAAPGAELVSQRVALQRLGLHGRIPTYDGNPATYAAALSRASEEAELLDPTGLGGFTWLVESVGGGRLWPPAPVGDCPA